MSIKNNIKDGFYLFARGFKWVFIGILALFLFLMLPVIVLGHFFGENGVIVYFTILIVILFSFYIGLLVTDD